MTKSKMVTVQQPNCARPLRFPCNIILLIGAMLVIVFYTYNKELHFLVFGDSDLLEADESMDNDAIDRRIFKEKELVIYSNDFHIGPIQDLKFLLKPLGVRFIDQSLSGHCHLTKTCQKGLKVISKGNGINLDPKLIPKFYEAYKNDPVMKSVDAFVCFHPSAMCELFMPFNKSLLVIASTRYELGRFGAKKWNRWNKNLVQISQDPKNYVAGNNMYDAKYIEYFTGVQPQVLTSYCGYIRSKYVGDRDGFILAPIHKSGFQKVVMKGYQEACKKKQCSVKLFPLRDKYRHYKYSDLAAHKGIVYVPYQVSVMSLFEQYRMNIPLFFPAKQLLADWQLNHMVMNERTWAGVGGKQAKKSDIPPHSSQKNIPDPNNDSNMTAIQHWIEYSDFYKFPFITLYESYDDLIDKLQQADLRDISAKMAGYNAQFKNTLRAQWSDILRNVAKYSPNKPH